MNERLKKKIQLLTRITCWDHHKTRDGIYEITQDYSAWSEESSWYWSHPGYIWDVECDHGYKSYEDAERGMEDRIDQEFWKNVKWMEEDLLREQREI